MDWYESQWLNTTKNGVSKWKNANAAVRNRTKVYIYPSFGHFDEIDVPKTTIRTTTTSVNSTILDEDTLIILPGIEHTHTHTQLRLNYCLFRYSSRLKCYEIPYLKTKMLKFHCRTRRYKWLQRRLVSVVSDIDRTNVAANWVWFTEAISRLTRCCLVGNLKRLSYCFLHTILSIVYILLAVATSTKEKIGSFTKLCSD